MIKQAQRLTVHCLFLSFPVRGGGAGHRPYPFQVAPEVSRIGCEDCPL